jgi:serine/threonine-protein kinase
LIDFGLARADVLEDGFLTPPSRGGVGNYYEPEYALARLAGAPAPPANPAGEQYALGALLYRMFTGCHYLPFQLEKEASWRQIANDNVRSFDSIGIEPWPESARSPKH